MGLPALFLNGASVLPASASACEVKSGKIKLVDGSSSWYNADCVYIATDD